jgi:hypothetical protein
MVFIAALEMGRNVIQKLPLNPRSLSARWSVDLAATEFEYIIQNGAGDEVIGLDRLAIPNLPSHELYLPSALLRHA